MEPSDDDENGRCFNCWSAGVSAVRLVCVDHEEALIRAFIVPKKQVRYLAKLRSPKTRTKFIGEHLYHMGDLDGRYATPVDPSASQAEQIYRELRERGAPQRCHAISSNKDLDARDLDLIDALVAIVELSDGTLLSCTPGRLAYYHGENSNDRWLLQKRE